MDCFTLCTCRASPVAASTKVGLATTRLLHREGLLNLSIRLPTAQCWTSYNPPDCGTPSSKNPKWLTFGVRLRTKSALSKWAKIQSAGSSQKQARREQSPQSSKISLNARKFFFSTWH
ncbi:hypothetical protein E2C01_030496 [Portunus trituberculatus]|uniref:Uncharacterized protein n=1 Tax=Portunus trituberculatus TaxID=210409 RepID=A0A5B7EXH6_PORTR|nr:hypothetical protein [Portunus trituberculatus]